MHISFFTLGMRALWRDGRSGALGLLVVAVTLAVAAVTAVGFFSDRLKGGLERDARQLLGGDAVVVSDQPTPEVLRARAQALGLQTASTLTFPTMARSAAPDGASKLVALKAVQPGYPLRGTLQLDAQPLEPVAAAQAPAKRMQAAQGIPARGQAWVDAAVLQALGMQVGDALLLGNSRLVVSATIALEPDRGAGFLNFAPRVMLNAADMADTGLIQPASRLNYRMAVAGDAAAVAQFVAYTQRSIQAPTDTAQTTPTTPAAQAPQASSSATSSAAGLRGVRLESLETGRPEMRQTLERAEKFLNLVALLSALLSAVAVALAARSFASQHLDDCAMLRVLGLSQRTIALGYTVEFAAVGMLASTLGVLLGYTLHHAFVWLMAGLLETALPAASAWPVAMGMGIGLTLLLAFGLPPVLQLAQVPPLRVIRREVGQLRSASLGVLLLGVLGFAAILLATSRDTLLGLISVGGFALALGLFAGLAWLAVRLLRRSVNEATAPRWLVLATRQISARPVYAVIQVSALALGLLALVLLVLLRTDLVDSWRKATPPDAPNRFVINIMPEQSAAFQQALGQGGVTRFDWYPMQRARLVAINQRAVTPEDYADDRAKRLVDREFNVSYSAAQPAHNAIVAGRWIDGERDAISIEEGIAKTLGLQVGDTLRFDAGGVLSESRITSLRKVDWGSMRVNFFALYPTAAPADAPLSFISAFRAPPAPDFDNALVRQFPNITSVDMAATLDQVQRVLGQVIRAVEFLFGFTLAAGLVVLFAALTASRDVRAHEFAIMRAVGAQNRLLRQVQRAELAGVGLLAGLLAALVATAVGWALARYVFEFDWSFPLWTPLWGSAAGAGLAWLAGWWGLRDILRQPVVQTLRKTSH